MKGENINLVRLESEDLPYIKKWRNEQKDVLRQNKILTDEDQKNWFELLSRDKKQKIFSIMDAEGKFVGYCGITHIDADNKRGEISFLLKTGISDKQYEKYFLDALNLLKIYSFSVLKLHKLFTETFEFRKFHISILEKFGFKRDGRLTQHVFKKGKFYDSLLHYILN